MGPKSKSATRKVDPKRSKKPTKDGTNADSATKSEKVGKNKSDKNRTSSKSSESRVKSASTKGNVSGKGKKDPSGSTNKKEASFLAKFLSCFKIGGHKSVPAPDNSASDQQLLEHALGEAEEEEPHFVVDAEDVKNFVHAWGNDFITNLISAYAFDEVYEKSTIEIQRVVRGYLGRRRAAHMWRVAVADFADFWNFKHENKMGDQEMLRRQQLVIQQVAPFLKNSFMLSPHLCVRLPRGPSRNLSVLQFSINKKLMPPGLYKVIGEGMLLDKFIATFAR